MRFLSLPPLDDWRIWSPPPPPRALENLVYPTPQATPAALNWKQNGWLILYAKCTEYMLIYCTLVTVHGYVNGILKRDVAGVSYTHTERPC